MLTIMSRNNQESVGFLRPPHKFSTCSANRKDLRYTPRDGAGKAKLGELFLLVLGDWRGLWLTALPCPATPFLVPVADRWCVSSHIWRVLFSLPHRVHSRSQDRRMQFVHKPSAYPYGGYASEETAVSRRSDPPP